MKKVQGFLIVITLVSLFHHVPTVAAEPGTDVAEVLSVEETLGAVLVRPEEGLPWNMYRHANKDAKNALFRLLANKKAEEYRPGILRVLAYIGDGSEVDKVQDAVFHGLSGLLTQHQRQSMIALFQALGIMSGRGIQEAETALKRMASLSYWERTKFRTRPASKEIKSKPGFEHQHEAVAWVLAGYGLSGKRDLAELCTSVLTRIEDPSTTKYMEWRIDPVRLAASVKNLRLAEKQPISAEERRLMAAAYQKHASLFAKAPEKKPRLAETDAGFIRKTIEEARQEFGKMRSNVVNSNFKALSGHLLDNGKVLDKKRTKRLWAEYENDLRREQQVFTSLAQIESTPRDYEVRCLVTYQFPTIAEKREIAATKTEEVWVSFRLSGTNEIGNVLFRRLKGSLTIARDGSLIVVMKKMDGQWYWNPFGW